jgi:lysozyme family protein
MNRFDKCFEYLIGVEGNYSNDLNDAGGETKYGISKRAYPQEDIKNLSLARAKEIYKTDYWDTCNCDNLPQPWDVLLFDSAVNHGVKRAIIFAQDTLNVLADGRLGTLTLTAIKQASKEDVNKFLAWRILYYVKLESFKFYGRGWVMRILKLKDFITDK